MVDFNPEVKNPIFTQPTDPDTLKILEKIKQDYHESTAELSNTERIAEARNALLHSMERRSTDPERKYVNTKITLVDPGDRKVIGLKDKIMVSSELSGTSSLAHRAKKQ